MNKGNDKVRTHMCSDYGYRACSGYNHNDGYCNDYAIYSTHKNIVHYDVDDRFERVT